ncbi:2-haloacid dehalogenase [Frondihabitans sp. PhB188]|uniref:haloacid dehalogenase type II n=1 Tax=Frondihabitans sp. PhB188 TaxID=2485200 RepID=UPI000F953DFF|nr:haloacid dehalogenase type II [Frondihabitans sp. PhB188]ROQ30925.1 2-haloacid dehalogenase [Frondihabitans sp. PhB188]
MATVIFDVNETLSDLSALSAAFDRVGAHPDLIETWFAGTLRDAFTLNFTTGPQPFQDVARSALLGLLSQEDHLTVSTEEAADTVMAAFAELPVHPDVPEGVRALARAGHRLVALSNGSVENTEQLLERAGLREEFALLLSVDDAGAWKPDRRAYEYALHTSGVQPRDAVLIAVHPWDLHGAHQAGLRTVFLDRTRALWPGVFTAPDQHVHSLLDVVLP